MAGPTDSDCCPWESFQGHPRTGIIDGILVCCSVLHDTEFGHIWTRIILKLDASGTACIMGSKMICFILKQFPSTTQKAEVQFRPHCVTKSSPQ